MVKKVEKTDKKDGYIFKIEGLNIDCEAYTIQHFMLIDSVIVWNKVDAELILEALRGYK